MISLKKNLALDEILELSFLLKLLNSFKANINPIE